jgi:hypothetical protein
MTTRPERSIAAARVKTAPVTPVDTAKYQSASVLAIGDGAMGCGAICVVGAIGIDGGTMSQPGSRVMVMTQPNFQYNAGRNTRYPPTRA